jgi:hypothetical protein
MVGPSAMIQYAAGAACPPVGAGFRLSFTIHSLYSFYLSSRCNPKLFQQFRLDAPDRVFPIGIEDFDLQFDIVEPARPAYGGQFISQQLGPGTLKTRDHPFPVPGRSALKLKEYAE